VKVAVLFSTKIAEILFRICFVILLFILRTCIGEVSLAGYQVRYVWELTKGWLRQFRYVHLFLSS
jgi:hypothetical protein